MDQTRHRTTDLEISWWNCDYESDEADSDRGVDDHVHLLLGAPETMAPSKAAQLIKGGSSAWIHTEFPNLRNFAWQDGYGAFTVSKSGLSEVKNYILNQREHHQRRTFKEEFLALLKRHEIEYDERYLWD